MFGNKQMPSINGNPSICKTSNIKSCDKLGKAAEKSNRISAALFCVRLAIMLSRSISRAFRMMLLPLKLALALPVR